MTDHPAPDEFTAAVDHLLSELDSMASDPEYTDTTLARCSRSDTHEDLTFATGWSFQVPRQPVAPQVGETVRQYGAGNYVRGLVIGGRVAFYRTAAEDHAMRAQELAAQQAAARIAYDAGRPAQLAEIARLPAVFQRRLERFLSNAPATAWAHQGYELAVCQAAVAIAAVCPLPGDVPEFAMRTYEAQIEQAPRLAELELTGNQHGMALRLAHWTTVEPDNVWREHAAIAIITGCTQAGCPPEVPHD
jgi:hypothetical protein